MKEKTVGAKGRVSNHDVNLSHSCLFQAVLGKLLWGLYPCFGLSKMDAIHTQLLTLVPVTYAQNFPCK